MSQNGYGLVMDEDHDNDDGCDDSEEDDDDGVGSGFLKKQMFSFCVCCLSFLHFVCNPADPLRKSVWDEQRNHDMDSRNY